MTTAGTDTRSRILEVAWGLVGERGTTRAVRIADIAAGAGVSRQLVYFHFENRAGLLAAMARHHDAASGFKERIAACGALPPVEGLEALLRAWLGYVPEILPVARALEAAEITGEEGGAAWRDRMGSLRDVFRAAVERVERDGRLADGWTIETAADWVWARGHLEGWQHLVVERGWVSEDYEERTVRSILEEVVSSGGA
ncbi:TetR/AcrR family transcriptional regulator [Rubrobacter tropicus]|uniref:TetR/AcrR family transcriptional regulator n=1 Tax=Rubrobacter tropicus TaxID=2653851 RepID=UPI00140BE554|nr:TetR family transcriptional regulator [Rubrobacter tropicus]